MELAEVVVFYILTDCTPTLVRNIGIYCGILQDIGASAIVSKGKILGHNILILFRVDPSFEVMFFSLENIRQEKGEQRSTLEFRYPPVGGLKGSAERISGEFLNLVGRI